jgi:hypothetical protein
MGSPAEGGLEPRQPPGRSATGCPDLSRSTKQRNTTLCSGRASSHARHPYVPLCTAVLAAEQRADADTQYTGGSARPRTHHGSLSACTAARSSDSNVLTRTPPVAVQRAQTSASALHRSSSGCSSRLRTRCHRRHWRHAEELERRWPAVPAAGSRDREDRTSSYGAPDAVMGARPLRTEMAAPPVPCRRGSAMTG